VPFGGADGSGTYRMVDRPLAPTDQLLHAFLQTVGGEYFKTLEIPLLGGRLFNDGDTATTPRVVVIDDFLAKRHFPGRSPVGQQLNFGSPRNYTIVGVVGTINSGDLTRQVAEERIYFTVQQVPQWTMGVLIKSAAAPESLVQPLRAAVQSLDPEQAISEVRTLDERLARALQPRRVPAMLFAIFGIVALTLSAIGVYGVMSFGVTERVREFGIRQALGADRLRFCRWC
jgi:putative ABC transport system permease protein